MKKEIKKKKMNEYDLMERIADEMATFYLKRVDEASLKILKIILKQIYEKRRY